MEPLTSLQQLCADLCIESASSRSPRQPDRPAALLLAHRALSAEQVGRKTLALALRVQRTLGPGLLDSVYRRRLSHELVRVGFDVRCGVAVPVRYGALTIDAGLELDMMVAGCVAVEHRVVDQLAADDSTRLRTILRTTGCRLGFLLNWNVPLLQGGIKRVVGE